MQLIFTGASLLGLTGVGNHELRPVHGCFQGRFDLLKIAFLFIRIHSMKFKICPPCFIFSRNSFFVIKPTQKSTDYASLLIYEEALKNYRCSPEKEVQDNVQAAPFYNPFVSYLKLLFLTTLLLRRILPEVPEFF
jgi:hypothetical protein